jgi:phosphoserine phosphatase
MRTIVFCYTIANTFHFSKEIIGALKDKGYKIVLISSRVKNLKYIAEELDVDYRYWICNEVLHPLKILGTLLNYS